MSTTELTDREMMVLRRVAAGETDATITKGLFVSRPTVASHLRSIRGKLGATTRANIVHLAHLRGILP